MRTWASSNDSKRCPFKYSSRMRELNDSMCPFCQGEPGSMKVVEALLNLHQSAMAKAANSGPLSHLR